jgi:hypothetical protein
MPCIPEPNNNAGAGVEEEVEEGAVAGVAGKAGIGLDAGACFGVLGSGIRFLFLLLSLLGFTLLGWPAAAIT